MSNKNFMGYGDAESILTEYANDIKSRVSTKANQGLNAQQMANAKANIDIDKVPNVATNDQTPTFLEESTRTNIASGDKLSLIFGKIKKFLSDLKAVAFSGSYNDLSNKPSIPAAVAVKGNAETTYRTGNVNLTPANIGACAGDAPSRSGTSLAIQMDSILASGKVGVFPMYCSSGNVDYPTIGYCMALGITSRASDVSAIVAFNTQTNDIWLNCNTANTPSGWTGWKKISSNPIKVQTLTINIPAVSAGRGCVEYKALPTVSGYKAIGIVGISPIGDAGTLSLNSFFVNNTSAYISYENNKSSATSAAAVTLDILYMKT